MAGKNKFSKEKLRKLQERSDRRTAEFVVRRIDSIQQDLGDLIPDLQTFDHYCQIAQVSYCLRILLDMRKRYRRYAEGHTWENQD